MDFKNTTYDTRGNPLSITHFNGAITTMTWDSPRGLPLTVTQASGTPLARTTTYTWSQDHRNPLTITSPITLSGATGTQTVTFTYNAAGNPLTRTTSNSINSTTRVELWGYNATTGLLESHDDGQGNITTYLHDTAGNLVSQSNALGHATTYSNHTRRGNPRLVVDPNGLNTVLTYDARDRVTQIQVGSAGTHFETSSIQYNPQGDISRITAPDGTYVQLIYDSADELIETAQYSAAGALLGRKLLVRDLTGKITETSVLDAAGTTLSKHSFTYDAASRLDKALGAANQATDVAYTNAGDLATSVDPLLHGQAFAYDALRRLIRTTDELNQQSHLAYDPQDNLVSATDARGVVTGYSYNAFSELIGIASNDRGNWSYARDGFGRISQVSGPRGETATPSYDALGRVSTINWSDAGVAPGTPGFVFGNKTATYSYDGCTNGIGRLCQVIDWTGTTAYSYDLWGRKTGHAFTPSGTTTAITKGYGYDAFGRLVSVIYPSGKTLTYSYGPDGQPSGLQWAGQPVVQQMAWQPITGQPLGWQWSAAGIPATRSQVAYGYDQDGRLQSISDTESVQVLRNADGNATGVSHLTQTDLNMAYGYDAGHRLVQADNALWAGPMSYGYDAVANRTSKAWGTDYWQYAYGATSNRLVSITPSTSGTPGTPQTRTMDAMGNTLNDGLGRTYAYDATGRLVSANTGVSQSNYSVGSDGLRVAKVVSGVNPGTKWYAYDDQRRLIGSYAPNGTGGLQVLEEIVYLPGSWQILGTVRGQTSSNAGTFYPVLSDSLGSPRLVLDPSDGATRWDWQAKEAFGHMLPNENPASHPSGAFIFDARFPGQWFDQETHLHHNGFRDYDPRTGRYVQSDPIGLEAGWNTYGYVGGDPVGAYDPLGLMELPALNQGFVDGAAGFGDMILSVPFTDISIKNLRPYLGIDSSVNCASDAYSKGEQVGVLVGLISGVKGASSGFIKFGQMGVPSGMARVTRWGRPGLEPGDWVMMGGKNRINYWFSGISRSADNSTAATYIVPKNSLRSPSLHRPANEPRSAAFMKKALQINEHQRIYKP